MFSPELKSNGGKEHVGTHAECFKKGFARGINQKPTDVHRFVQKWSGKYKAHIPQKLWHRDDPVPPGYQLATLSQTMGKGYALGCIALAKKFKNKTVRAKSQISTKKPMLPTTTKH